MKPSRSVPKAGSRDLLCVGRYADRCIIRGREVMANTVAVAFNVQHNH
jgi:hypothetical protein